MSGGSPTPRPTDAELTILRVLWRRGPSTVRAVQEELANDRGQRSEGAADGPGYTTVLKLLQIMTEKGLVAREEVGRAHVYRPAQSEEHAQRRLVGDLLDRVFGGSAQKLVMQALTARETSPEELAEIRRLLDELEGKTG
jgi:BlaI family transcriptional regulator, penicillinase repressor